MKGRKKAFLVALFFFICLFVLSEVANPIVNKHLNSPVKIF